MLGNEIYWNVQYLELTAKLAKASGQKELFQKVIRMLHLAVDSKANQDSKKMQKLANNLKYDLIKLNDSMEDMSMNRGIPKEELFPDFSRWNKLESTLVSQGLRHA